MTLLSRGQFIDRYVILAPLGQGGMGVVYAAYDPELDRKIALKLLLPGQSGRLDGAGRARLLREAQALARLAHPNVVAVYDVGMHEELVWIAMELVAGKTLNIWAKSKLRKWPEILLVLTDVARGVAAAHEAGLVHRDLKPENVMLDGKGRVRVMDFGLAHGRAATIGNEFGSALQPGAESLPETAALTLCLTQAGALNGTPAYMSPEQWQGQEASAAADQFGWSVMAWELLFGERPFAGDTMDELAGRVISGQRRPPLRGRRVPGWLRRIVERGLLPQPSERWPTMTALLTALERGRTRSRVKSTALILMAATIIGAAPASYERWVKAQQVAACSAEGASIVEVWNEKAQKKLRDGLLASGVSYAETTAEKVIPIFDAQAEAWRQLRTEACVAAQVQGNWDEGTLDQSVWCLDERRMELEALVAELSRVTPVSVQQAVPAAAGLPRVEPCQDAERLRMLPPLPSDRESVRAVRWTLSRAKALRAAGEYQNALEVAQEALEAAEKIGWPPLTAAVRWRYGDLLAMSGKYQEAEKELESAYFEAAEVGALEDAADAAVSLTWTLGYLQKHNDEARRWSRHANILLSLLGENEKSPRRAEALNSFAVIQNSMGEYEEAKELHKQALSIWEISLGPEHPDLASSLNNLANVYHNLGALEDAEALHKRALAIREPALGSDHPSVAISLSNLATVYEDMREYEKAKAHHKRAVTIMEKSLSPDHPNLATALSNLASTYSATEEYHEAKTLLERAKTIMEKSLGLDHPDLAAVLSNLAEIHCSTRSYEEAKLLYQRTLALEEKALGPEHLNVALDLSNLAFVHFNMGAHKEAKALNERAYAIREKTLGADHLDVAVSLDNLAAVQYSLGAYSDAKALYERALVIRQKKLGADHPDLASPLTGLAMVALAQARPTDAVALALRAVRIRESSNSNAPPEQLARSRIVLAQALWDAPLGQGHNQKQAMTEARQARDAFMAQGFAKELAEAEAFLVEHGPSALGER